MDAVNIASMLDRFTEHWAPRNEMTAELEDLTS
jgi:hypothetical protein